MKFAYKADGTVTGLNNPGQDDELTGTCTPQDLVFGMVAEYYTAPNGTLTPRSQAEISTIKANIAKLSARDEQLRKIEQMQQDKNLENFQYNGNYYISDKSSIQATQNDCLVLSGSDPINTLRGTQYEGHWKTANGFVRYTAAEFLEFAAAYFLRGSDNFTTRSTHMMAIEDLYEDQSKTAEDIMAYDYSEGWH